MSGIIGKKIGMTRLIQDDGRVIPITVVKCDPNEVAQVKTVEKDGYPAIVLGFDALKKPTKTVRYRHLREF
ncbi:50S ribosomal protein L3, partial [Candidatus Peregrinibacteria bacterium]|nr:50S ribosomal protein L3 [Candidatus Peregrinibacteria bacterium]